MSPALALRHATLTLLASLGAVAPALAQPVNWVITRSPGGVIDAQTQARVIDNQSRAAVTAAGGSAGLGVGLVAAASARGQAQVNSIGLSGIAASDSELLVLRNELSDLVNAFGGQAAVNTLQIHSAGERRPLVGSRLLLQSNRGGQVESFGGDAALGVGAASLSVVGRAAANSVLIDNSDLRHAQVNITHNRATQLQAMGGLALAQVLAAERSQLDRLYLLQSRNEAQDILSGGGSAGLGWTALAHAEMRGAAAANSVVIAGSHVQGATLMQQANQARALNAVGGSAFANSVNLSDYQGGSLAAYTAVQRGNTARDVQTRGGSAQLLGGALADVQIAATALANSIVVQQGSVGGATRHTLQGNQAEGVHAVGGGAAANSLWLAQARSQGSDLTLINNHARGVSTASESVSIGMGAVGSFERNGRALANSVALADQAVLDASPVLLRGNRAEQVRGAGGLAAGNSVVVLRGELRGSRVRLSGNRAHDVQAQGFATSAGGGLLMSASQNAMALANSLGVFGGRVEGAVTLADNTARALSAQGGKLIANSLSVEGIAGNSRLNADATLTGNQAERISTGASSLAGPGHVFSSESDARAAVNALVLRDDAQVDAASGLRVAGNRATEVAAVGGTALVNTLAGYRGARVIGSPLTLADNRAAQISAGGSYGQVAGFGQAKNGILVANGVYLEGERGVHVSGAPLTLQGNVALDIRADGGRVNANAVAVNGAGQVQGHAMRIAGNQAEGVISEGSEGTVAGAAVINRGVGHANANAVQALGAIDGGSSTVEGNRATGVHASQGLAQANSITTEREGAAEGSTLRVTGNTANGVVALDGRAAAANSVHNAGRLSGATLSIERNEDSSALAFGDDAQAASVRNRAGARITQSTVAVTGNRGGVFGRGSVNSLDNGGTLQGTRITILNNRGQVDEGGAASSVVNHGGGRITGGQIAIVGNQGKVRDRGTANSVGNRGHIDGSRIAIVGNRGTSEGGGLVNSVGNAGQMKGANITIAGNDGRAERGGTVNSVDNRGTLSGHVAIVGNRGLARGDGVANSVVNHGRLSGQVVIAGNQGIAGPGGVANSVINHGVISGRVAIVGNRSAALFERTVGSVRTKPRGTLTGAAGVKADTPWAQGVGGTVAKPPTGVIRRSVTVGPATTTLNM